MSVQTSFFTFIRFAHAHVPRNPPLSIPPFYPFEQDRWIVIDRERGLTPSSCWHAAVAIILSTFSLISRAHPQEVGGGTEGGRVAGRVHASGWEKDEHGNSRVTPP